MRRAPAPAAAALAGAWAGMLGAVAAMAAPAAFALLPVADAGRFVGRLFAQEAALSLGLALLLVFVERRRNRLAADQDPASTAFSTELGLVLGTVFCTVAGYYAVLPMMAAARAGQGAWSFAALHALAGGFFALKSLLVLALLWRYARAGQKPSLTAAAKPS